MCAEADYVRVDLASKVVGWDENERIVRWLLTPDPRRYESFEERGITYWRDKYLDFIFTLDTLREMAALPIGTPLLYSSPSEKPDQHRELAAISTETPLTFLSVDVVNSTKTRARFGQKYDDALDLLIKEMGRTVGQFHGNILKFTGDGFICYLDHPSINTQCDTAVNLGIVLLGVLGAVNEATSPVHPKLKVRVGAEHGRARIKVIEVPATGYNKPDILADALNRAAKIQEKSPANSLVIGRALYERIHVQWLERTSPLKLGVKVGVQNYRTYIVI